jgi:hypothetical protein
MESNFIPVCIIEGHSHILLELSIYAYLCLNIWVYIRLMNSVDIAIGIK